MSLQFVIYINTSIKETLNDPLPIIMIHTQNDFPTPLMHHISFTSCEIKMQPEHNMSLMQILKICTINAGM